MCTNNEAKGPTTVIRVKATLSTIKYIQHLNSLIINNNILSVWNNFQHFWIKYLKQKNFKKCS